jgi:flagellar biosynthetic protein FliR
MAAPSSASDVAPLALPLVATLVATLRIVPTLAFAPPYTLLRVPALVRVLLAVALAGWIVAAQPRAGWVAGIDARGLIVAAGSELLLGIALALSLQFAFAALLTVGRALDVQVGFGLAMLVDPTTRGQMPLIGTVLAYATAALFFAGDGPAAWLAIWAASFDHVPLGLAGAIDPAPLLAAIAGMFVAAAGLGGALTLALFLTDLAIAFMSRTLPQMNVLLLGFQVKTLVALALLPATVALSGGLFLTLLRLALDAAPRLLLATR